ncbi:MAG: autotransporter outer membrane beta-barrel domain-containing protein, partial [Gammaproteobacteria bacterium]|nr:autotransporter outer membrane beta-barrel domain-containing protein [Gammaproteobacteria bacterium]
VVVTLNEGMPTDVNEVILPELARAIGATQLNSVVSRIGKLRAGSGAAANARLGGHSTLEDLASRRAQGMVDGNIDMKEVLGKSGFVMPLGGGLGAGAGAGGGGFGSGMVFWGEGEYRGIGGKDKGLDWDGNLLSFSMGMDGHLREGLVGGLMVSWSEADLEYKDDTTNNGEYDLEITSLVPYAGWSVLDGQIDLWAMGGYGIGDLDVKEGRDEPVLSSDVNMWSLGLGGSGALVEYGENEVRLKAEVFMTRTEVDGSKEVGGSFIPQATADTHRLRLLLETSRTRLLASGASLTPSGEAGLRYDGGDGRTGGGAEMGGGLKYRDGGRGLTLEGRARVLLGHSADYEDWGVSGNIQWDAGADGQGLTLSLSPAYGKTSSGTQGIWSNGLFDSDSKSGNDLHARMDVKMGYGLKAFTDTGLLVPYSEMSFGADGNRGYRLGVEWTAGEQFQLKLSGERKEKDNAAPTHGILFKGEIRF